MAGVRKVMGKKFFRDWKDLNDNWGKAVERNMGRKGEVDRASKQVDVERLKRKVECEGWGMATRVFNGRHRSGQGANSCSKEVT